MKYLNESVGSAYIPKLLGTYEQELHAVLEHLIASQPTTVLNIGAAEGYYAVGLARRLPNAKFVCWEASPHGQKLLEALLEANAIASERCTVNGFCSLTSLRDALACVGPGESTLGIVDIEGGEALLLDPVMLPGLTRCHLLVEVHEFAIRGVEQLLLDRFSATHDIERIEARKRSLEDWPTPIRGMVTKPFEGAALTLMSEARPSGMGWLYMAPNGT
jgi:hypothetical protein